jgi:hypothetical protein
MANVTLKTTNSPQYYAPKAYKSTAWSRFTSLFISKTSHFQQLEATQRLSRQQRFNHNYETIMRMNPGDLLKYRVQDGILVETTTLIQEDSEDAKKTLALIQQTYREAYGKVIDAQLGYGTIGQALKTVNDLKEKLLKIYPEAISTYEDTKSKLLLLHPVTKEPIEIKITNEEFKEDLGKTVRGTQVPGHLSILTNTYRQATGMTKLDLERTACEEEIERNRGNQERLETKRTIGSGINKPDYVGNETGDYAVEKPENEDTYTFRFLGGFHELVASDLNVLLGGRLGIPLATRGRGTTIHAFATKETFRERVVNNGGSSPTIDSLSAQRCVITQLLFGNTDCHAGNLLMTDDGSVIPIDFGRSMEPGKPIRGVYFQFPGLDEEVNEKDREFFRKMDIESVMSQLEKQLRIQYKEEFANRAAREVIEKKLAFIKARLYMLKIGMEKGLTLRQIIALDLPPIPEGFAADFDKKLQIQRENLRKSGRLTPLNFRAAAEECFQSVKSDIKYVGHFQGFRSAWVHAYRNSKLETADFKKAITEQIEEVKKKAEKNGEVWGKTEQEVYRKAYHDLWDWSF